MTMIRQWCKKFGFGFAKKLKKRRVRAFAEWHELTELSKSELCAWKGNCEVVIRHE